METIFSINISDFIDDNRPFTYSYFYFLNPKAYQNEIKKGSNQLITEKNLLQDTTH